MKLHTAEELKAMSREMSKLYDEGYGIQAAGKVRDALWSARKAAMALETGESLFGFETSARREINDAIVMYEEFKANL